MPSKPVIHIAFGTDKAALQKAFAKAGRGEQVIGTGDLLAIGRIAAADSGARARSVNEILGVTDWGNTVAENAPLLAASLAADRHPVVWFSRRDTQSYAGFLWWLSHRGDGPCDIVDVTEVMLPARKLGGQQRPARLAVYAAAVPPAALNRLRDQARPLLAVERQRYQRMWAQLLSADTPLRVIEGDELVAAPLTFFDPLLMSLVVEQWRKMLRIFLEVYCGFANRDLHQADALLLHARLRTLVREGIIEAVGDIDRMDYCEVRLPVGKKC